MTKEDQKLSDELFSSAKLMSNVEGLIITISDDEEDAYPDKTLNSKDSKTIDNESHYETKCNQDSDIVQNKLKTNGSTIVLLNLSIIYILFILFIVLKEQKKVTKDYCLSLELKET